MSAGMVVRTNDWAAALVSETRDNAQFFNERIFLMRYLGKLHGAGVLISEGETFARADYDLEGFLTKLGHALGAGEIRAAPETLREIFGRKGLQLQTDDGPLAAEWRS